METGTILIAEDSIIQATVLKKLLTKTGGYRVTVAKNGVEALQTLRSEPVTLVISDIEMPEMDGYELCRFIKTDPKLCNTPVILLTGLGEPENVIEGLRAGADNYVTKPCDNELLLSRVRSILASPELCVPGPPEKAIPLWLAGKSYEIRAPRQQILNLLVSTFESAVWQNRGLAHANDQLSLAHRDVAAKNRQLEESLAHQNEFLGMATHDMRNPLSVISGYSKFLLAETSGTINEKQRKFLQSIQDSSQFLLQMVNELLMISEIDAGHLRLERRDTDLPKLVARAVELNSFLAEAKGIVLQMRTVEGPQITNLNIDSNKIEQVINNLISNAVKFSHPNTQVWVELAHEIDWIRLSVIDRGQGIPSEELDKLFKPFQKTSVRSTAGEKSTGLGLAITKRIVEGHGGTIKVESKLGEGSTFHVRLPVFGQTG